VKLYRQRKTPNSFTTALWQSNQQSSNSKHEELVNDEFGLTKYFCSYLKQIFSPFSFPFPFVPLQRRGCLVAPLFLWIVLVPCAGHQPSDRGGGWRGEYDRVRNRYRLKLTPDLTTRWATGNDNFVYSSLWDFKSSFTCRKILRHGTFPLYFPSERKVCCGFLSPLKIHRLGRARTRNLWAQWPEH
jgi:hypothetical protein